MLAPLNRFQSPVSTANANAVRVEMPRRHANRCIIAVNSLSSASVVICSHRGVTAGCGHEGRLVGVVEGGLRSGGVQALQA